MRTLILGSFPPHPDRWDYEFYYPNFQNRFWKVLAQIAGRPLITKTGPDAVAERRILLDQLHIGLQNTGKVITRKGKSSLDQNILIEEFHDLRGLIDESPRLRSILITGFSGPSSAYHSFIRYLNAHKIPIQDLPARPQPGLSFEIHCKRQLRCHIANSTSPAARRVKFDDLVEQFRRAIEG